MSTILSICAGSLIYQGVKYRDYFSLILGIIACLYAIYDAIVK